ncbi:uncharacterized protein LOC127790973 [Diospyros lotus]|uniref:uncharacterized protein LOC127790973 n=1 Tax=Diospyros lotus TaxID=55363 RepID=UPI002250AA15|nr:uncharacterized protein LOC127790973 [Diospyros lotus]
MNCTEPESRPVLGPAGNKQASKPLRKVEKPPEVDETKGKKAPSSPVVNTTPSPPQRFSVPSILRQQDQRLLKSNWSLNASCSSDASSDSSHSRASTGRLSRRSVTPRPIRRKQCGSKTGKVEKVVADADTGSAASGDTSPTKKRCAWVTPNTGMFTVSFIELNDDRAIVLNYNGCFSFYLPPYKNAWTFLIEQTSQIENRSVKLGISAYQVKYFGSIG